MFNSPQSPLTRERAIDYAQDALERAGVSLASRTLVTVTMPTPHDGEAGEWLLLWQTDDQRRASTESPTMRGGGALRVQVAGDGTVRHSFAR